MPKKRIGKRRRECPQLRYGGLREEKPGKSDNKRTKYTNSFKPH